MMELIVVTSPDMLPGEAVAINALFDAGLALLHMRKPGMPEGEIAHLLGEIRPAFRDRIALHQHHGMAGAFGISRLHFTETARLAQSSDRWGELRGEGFTLSTSLHRAADLETLSHSFEYAFLGPVFDSISKEGYLSAFPPAFELDKSGFPNKVIALGGIQPENMESAVEMGFDGVAALGCIWNEPDRAVGRFGELALRQASILQRKSQPPSSVSRLHFISQENAELSHIESIALALEAGCRWIQLRVKNRPEAEVLSIAVEVACLCDRYEAKLIINDFPIVALEVGAHGLHLGLSDMPIPAARALVGTRMIIGGTANTWDDIRLRVAEGADYIGLGPFRFTKTKQNLSPILGPGGYSRTMQQMAAAGFSVPIIAIGGIMPDDIATLRQAGVHGVAMSASLLNASDPKQTVYQIQQALC